MQSLRIALWNLGWRRPNSRAAQAIRRHFATWSPDLSRLTESHVDLLSGGHQIEAEKDYGYGPKPGRRKVILWFRWPWREVDRAGSAHLPLGRFVSGTTTHPWVQSSSSACAFLRAMRQ